MASRKDSVRPYTRTEQVQTTLTLGEREQLDARAAAEVVSRADLIRRLILEGMKPTEQVERVPKPIDQVQAKVETYHREMQRLAALRRENQS